METPVDSPKPDCSVTVTPHRSTRSSRKAGFTLIELSIVLVVIGLIVGGILVGQDLIRVAYVRATISQCTSVVRIVIRSIQHQIQIALHLPLHSHQPVLLTIIIAFPIAPADIQLRLITAQAETVRSRSKCRRGISSMLIRHDSHTTPSRKSGFTLIEMSIVFVVIGLIVGGILVGQDLIRAAGVRSQISQIEKFNTATNTFYGKYGYLPGDIPKTTAASFGFTARSGSFGDGNGAGL